MNVSSEMGLKIWGSPYESDWRLAWAYRHHMCGYIVTMDCDLLALADNVIRWSPDDLKCELYTRNIVYAALNEGAKDRHKLQWN